MSPTTKSAALSGTAFKSACISRTSIMEASSITSRSQSSGLSSPRRKPPVLGTMGAVVDPFARGCDPFAGRNGCGMANHGHHVTMAGCFGAQNAKAVLSIMVGYPLD